MKASQKGHVDVVNVLLDHNPKVNHLTSSVRLFAVSNKIVPYNSNAFRQHGVL